MEISLEEAGSLLSSQEEASLAGEENYYFCPSMKVEEFLSFFNPCPIIDSEHPTKIS